MPAGAFFAGAFLATATFWRPASASPLEPSRPREPGPARRPCPSWPPSSPPSSSSPQAPASDGFLGRQLPRGRGHRRRCGPLGTRHPGDVAELDRPVRQVAHRRSPLTGPPPGLLSSRRLRGRLGRRRLLGRRRGLPGRLPQGPRPDGRVEQLLHRVVAGTGRARRGRRPRPGRRSARRTPGRRTTSRRSPAGGPPPAAAPDSSRPAARPPRTGSSAGPARSSPARRAGDGARRWTPVRPARAAWSARSRRCRTGCARRPPGRCPCAPGSSTRPGAAASARSAHRSAAAAGAVRPGCPARSARRRPR